jgi:hypothetical protein
LVEGQEPWTTFSRRSDPVAARSQARQRVLEQWPAEPAAPTVPTTPKRGHGGQHGRDNAALPPGDVEQQAQLRALRRRSSGRPASLSCPGRNPRLLLQLVCQLADRPPPFRFETRPRAVIRTRADLSYCVSSRASTNVGILLHGSRIQAVRVRCQGVRSSVPRGKSETSTWTTQPKLNLRAPLCDVSS